MVTSVLVFRPPAENPARGEEESGTLSPSRPHTLILAPLSSLSCLSLFFHLLSLLSLPPTLPTLPLLSASSLPLLPLFLSPSFLPPSFLSPSFLPPSFLPPAYSTYPLFNPSPLSPSFLQLNEVMEKETYNTAREILERFDPSHPSLHAPNPARQNQERQPNTPRSGSGQSCVASSEDINSSY